ncbi:MAG: hypothetical protein KDD36_11875 [Flavobacteriales bacterium]|nr:hypothetical protein [Flavobacteriales bacterium]
MKDVQKFSTNINCNGCVTAVTETLNRLAGEGHWNVDTNSEQKILTVEGNADGNEIINQLNIIGYTAEILEN